VKATVCQNCLQFLQLQEEDIAPHLKSFVTAVWGLLVSCGPSKAQDNVAMHAIAFLTAVCCSTHLQLFASGDTIKQARHMPLLPHVWTATNSADQAFCAPSVCAPHLRERNAPECSLFTPSTVPCTAQQVERGADLRRDHHPKRALPRRR
jgi:hypothetical protein